MNNIPLWAQIVIALIASGLFGAIAGVISSSITAKQKFKELYIPYHQKLNDNLLQNTRQYIDTLYIPINKSLSNLVDKYDVVKVFYRNIRALEERKRQEAKMKSPPDYVNSPQLMEVENFAHELAEKAISDYRRACLDHKKLIDEISEQGKDIYLTIEFDELLRSFNRFLYASGRFAKSLKIMTYKEMEEELYASETTIGSDKFEERFFRYIHDLKCLIKDITLGTMEVRKNKPS